MGANFAEFATGSEPHLTSWERKNLNLPESGTALDSAKRIIGFNKVPDFSSEEYNKIDKDYEEERKKLAPIKEGILSQTTPDAGDNGDHIRVYRGFDVHPDHINYQQLGQHWALHPVVADYFAAGGNSVEADPSSGTIIEGLVHKKHVFTAEHPGFKEFRAYNNIDNNPGEREVPLLPGAPITIKNVFHMTHTPDSADSEHYMNNENWGKATKVEPPTGLGRA